jgi:hypothetical protein
MMFFGIILARKREKPLSSQTINHEEIHAEQARESGGFVPYYGHYLIMSLKYGYRDSPFECEAYDNEGDLDYLKTRKAFAWKKYIM